MSKAETPAEDDLPAGALFQLTESTEATTVASLREAADIFVRRYLDEMDGELGTDFYELVLSQVEAPLLRAVMEYTRGNQSRAAQMLGLNRGTLRKKLKHHGLPQRGGYP